MLKEANYLAEIKLDTALMTDKEIVDQLGRRGGTTVYLVKSTKSEHSYILKHISVPETQNQVSALIFSGAAADEEAAQGYYQTVVSDYREELELLESLSTSPNLRCFHSYEIKPKTDGIGFDVFLLAEDKLTLEQYLYANQVTQASAVNLALDLCNALNDLRNAGLIHRDVKPSNIFLGNQGHFMLGDLGIARTEQLKYCSMPESMLSPFSAPELFELMAEVNQTVDIYSVGLILYRIYNGNHAPFEDEKTSAKGADKLRITGQELPAPMFADYEMGEIIRKACAFKPEDRYQTPEELKQALVDYMVRNQVGEDPITPPIVADENPLDEVQTEDEVEPVQFADTEAMDEDFIQNFSPDNEMLNALIESVHRITEEDVPASEVSDEAAATDETMQAKGSKTRRQLAKWGPTALVFVLLLALIATAVWFFFIRVDTLHIDKLTATDLTTDSITIAIETEEEPGTFEIQCSDGYGSVQKQKYEGEPLVFSSLISGAQYTFSVQGFDGEKIAGMPSVYATTVATTNIISLVANTVAVDHAELTFVIDGTEPEEWCISYGPTGKDPATKVFTGHSVMLSGLEPDTEYVATMQDLSSVHLSGTTSVIFRTPATVSIVGEVIVDLSGGVGTLSWEYDGPAPENWTVTCVGTQGYENTVTVTDSSCRLEGLVGGETYTVTITSPSMLSVASLHFTPDAMVITEVAATPGEGSTAQIDWTCQTADSDAQWLVVYTPANTDMEAVVQTDGTGVQLTGLIPGVSYDIEIRTIDNEPVEGGKGMLIMPDAEVFSAYGFTSAYVGIWLRPGTEDWTVSNLSTVRTSFSPDEKIAFACESLSVPQDSTDTVSTLLVVRDSAGTLVDYYTGEEVWSNMWTKHGGKYLYVGELLRTPQQAGTYSLEIYFNSLLVNSGATISFTVK